MHKIIREADSKDATDHSAHYRIFYEQLAHICGGAPPKLKVAGTLVVAN